MSQAINGILLWARLFLMDWTPRDDNHGIVAAIIAILIIVVLILVIILLLMILVPH